MATVESSSTTSLVTQQYDRFPYPYRDPAEEGPKLHWCSMDELNIVNRYLFRGMKDFHHGFRALVAGGGTGDATVYLAMQLAHTDASIVHLDLSESAIQIARERLKRRGLLNKVRFRRGSLLDLPSMGLEPFDYINCTGVLHHLDDPPTGLRALLSVLKDDGGMALMVYGRYGRTAVYQMQEMMRLLHPGPCDPRTKVENVKAVIEALPPSNWLKRTADFLPQGQDFNDTEIYDLFLHAKDRPYSIPELYELLDGAGLRLVEFPFEFRPLYEPAFTFQAPKLKELTDSLSKRQRQAVAELYWGRIIKHSFWTSQRADTVADPSDPDQVPTFTWWAGMQQIRKSILAEEGTWEFDIELQGFLTVTAHLPMSPINRRLVELIDGQRSTGQIIGILAEEFAGTASAEQVAQTCVNIVRKLCSVDLLTLHHVGVQPLPQT